MGLAKVATVVAFVAALCAVVLGGGYGHGRNGDYGMMGYGAYNGGFNGGYGAYYSAPMYSYGYMSPGYGLYGAAQGITQGVGTAIGGVAGGISALLPLIIMVIVVIFILGFLQV